jgi:hypothetical protein
VRRNARLLKSNGRDFTEALSLPSVEVISAISLLMLGGYMLQDGTSDQSAIADLIVVGGAVCLALGVLVLVLAGKSVLADRRMARHLRGR